LSAVTVRVLFHDTLRLTLIHSSTPSTSSAPADTLPHTIHTRFAAEGIKKLRSLYAPDEHVLRVESVGTEPGLGNAGTATETVAPFTMPDSRTAAADAAPLMDDAKGGDEEILRREITGNDDMSGASADQVNLASAAADIDRVPKDSTGMIDSEPVPPPQVASAEPETLEGQDTAILEMDPNEGITLWRGLRNIKVADAFTKSGGTEQALMSTTKDISVAVRYSLSSFSLLFKIKAEDFMRMGADLEWLSAFPQEAEFLYPPLTYLEPTGRTSGVSVERGGQEFRFSIVEVIPVMG
jgi:hypothetical protein